jgi:mono/diheme cytochrome c family protein
MPRARRSTRSSRPSRQRISYHQSLTDFRKLIAGAIAIFALTACRPPLPPSKPLSELTPQEAAGHQVYAAHCARCHYANSDRSLHGPGLQALYKQKYLPSGAPANDDRVTAVILHGRNMMPAFGNNIDEQQLDDLLAYLHTL